MKQNLQEYLFQSGPSTNVRIYTPHDIERFNALKRRLTRAANRKPFSQAQVMTYLLDLEELVDEIYKQNKPTEGKQ